MTVLSMIWSKSLKSTLKVKDNSEEDVSEADQTDMNWSFFQL